MNKLTNEPTTGKGWLSDLKATLKVCGYEDNQLEASLEGLITRAIKTARRAAVREFAMKLKKKFYSKGEHENLTLDIDDFDQALNELGEGKW